MPKLELFYKPTCPFCRKVTSYLTDRPDLGIIMTNIEESHEDRLRLSETGGKIQVPCLLIDGQAMYESDDIITYLKTL